MLLAGAAAAPDVNYGPELEVRSYMERLLGLAATKPTKVVLGGGDFPLLLVEKHTFQN